MKQVQKEIDEYSGNTLLYNDLHVKYKEITTPDERVDDIKRLRHEIEEYIKEIQFILNTIAPAEEGAAATVGEINVGQAAEIYHKDLLPRVERLRKIEYEVVELEIERDENGVIKKGVLHKFENSLEKNEIMEKDDTTHVIKWEF
jgi:hypothetical protein